MSELAYKRTNVYEKADEKLLKEIFDYAEGYKVFLDEGKTEREACAYAKNAAIAAGNSKQNFVSTMNGNAPCKGHTECDAIIMDDASVKAAPCLSANHVDAELIHEAAIGKIAGEQLIKLMQNSNHIRHKNHKIPYTMKWGCLTKKCDTASISIKIR